MFKFKPTQEWFDNVDRVESEENEALIKNMEKHIKDVGMRKQVKDVVKRIKNLAWFKKDIVIKESK